MPRVNLDTNMIRHACLRLKKASTGDAKTKITNNELDMIADMLNNCADELDHLRTQNAALMEMPH